MIEILTDLTYNEQVASIAEPLLIDFWADWCGPCHKVAPVVEEIARERSGDLRVAKLDIEANPHARIQAGIMSLPTLVLYKGGEIVDTFIGAGSKQQIDAWLDSKLKD